MTSRERVQCVLNNRLPDRLPFNFWMDRLLMTRLDEKLGDNFRVTYYGADVIETFPAVPWFPELAGRGEYIEDERKIVWTKKYPLQDVEDLDLLVMPDVDCPQIYDPIRADRAKYPDKALFALISHPFEVLTGQFGLENLFYILYDGGDKLQEVLRQLTEKIIRIAEHCIECDVDVIYLAGDICTTKSEMLSEEMLRRFCFEPMKPIIERIHACGKKVFFHTDGRVMNILHLFVEYGIDGINPLQSNCNDKAAFAEHYGDKLMVYGGIDNCFTIPNGTVEEVRQHIRENFRLLGKNGRYIASSHDIPEQVPMENIEAMVDELKRCVYNREE